MILNELGKIRGDVAYRVMLGAVMLFIVAFVGRWFYQIVFEDSVGESTIKEISQRAISASSQLMSGQKTINDQEFGNATAEGFPIIVYPLNNQFFEMTLMQVPESVCTYITDKKPTLLTSIYINGVLYQRQPEICQKSNTISLEFSKDLNVNVPDSEKPYRTHCQKDSDCLGCQACQNGLCQSGCNQNETCGLTLAGKNMCCAPVNQVGSVCCSYVEGEECCWGRNKCCPKDKPIRLENGECVGCYDPKPFAVGNPPEVALCQTFCPNRVAYGLNEMCMMPICGKDQFLSMDGECVPCHQGGEEATSLSECSKCGNRTYRDGKCIAPCLDGTVMDKNGQCVACDEVSVLILKKRSDCSKCPDREIGPNGCQLKNCPKGYMRGEDGVCYSCSERNVVKTIEAECQKCSAYGYDEGVCHPICAEGQFLTADGQCASCLTPKVAMATEMECQKCQNRLGYQGYCFAGCGQNQFRDSDGSCHDCFDKGSYPVIKTGVCNVCPNRQILIKREDGQNHFYCRLDYCPSGYYIDEIGGCHDCEDEQAVIPVAQAECEKCTNRMWSQLNHQCLIKPSCMNEEMIDAEGKCVSCYEPSDLVNVIGQVDECDKCSERYVYGSWCRNCPVDVRELKEKKGCQKCGGKWDNRLAQCLI